MRLACQRNAWSHEWLIRFVEHRVGDRRVIRLIRIRRFVGASQGAETPEWLKAGVAEDEQVTPGTVGTPQGAVISPLLANIYLHDVFDLWAKQWRQRHAHGDVIMVRYADQRFVGASQAGETRGTTSSSASSIRPTPNGSWRRCERVWRHSP